MLMMPRRVTRRKQFRGRMKGKATRGNVIAYGSYGLVATEPCWLTANQLEAARVAINKFTKRGGRVWINVFPQKPVSKKPIGTRMGKGKGAPEYWVAVVKPGRVLFEIGGIKEEIAMEAMRLATHKLPCKVKIMRKADLEAAQGEDK